jgi:hypothetical protein
MIHDPSKVHLILVFLFPQLIPLIHQLLEFLPVLVPQLCSLAVQR